MKKEDTVRFTKIMMAMAENYPGASLTGNGLKLRFEALKEFSIDQVSMAAVKLIKIHKYNSMPTTADMINAMDDVPGRISTEHRAEIEAGKVLDHLRYFGKSVPPCFDDPITRHLMGHRWRYYAWASHVKESELKWWCQDFVRAYKAHAAEARAGYCFPVNSEVSRLSHAVGQLFGVFCFNRPPPNTLLTKGRHKHIFIT